MQPHDARHQCESNLFKGGVRHAYGMVDTTMRVSEWSR